MARGVSRSCPGDSWETSLWVTWEQKAKVRLRVRKVGMNTAGRGPAQAKVLGQGKSQPVPRLQAGRGGQRVGRGAGEGRRGWEGGGAQLRPLASAACPSQHLPCLAPQGFQTPCEAGASMTPFTGEKTSLRANKSILPMATQPVMEDSKPGTLALSLHYYLLGYTAMAQGSQGTEK